MVFQNLWDLRTRLSRTFLIWINSSDGTFMSTFSFNRFFDFVVGSKKRRKNVGSISSNITL